MTFVRRLLQDIVDSMPESLQNLKERLQKTISGLDRNLSGTFAPHTFNPSNRSCVQDIVKHIEASRDSLMNDDPNSIESDILKKAARVNTSPKTTFESRFILRKARRPL